MDIISPIVKELSLWLLIISSTTSTRPSKPRDIRSSRVPLGLERLRKEPPSGFVAGLVFKVEVDNGVGGSGLVFGFVGVVVACD